MYFKSMLPDVAKFRIMIIIFVLVAVFAAAFLMLWSRPEQKEVQRNTVFDPGSVIIDDTEDIKTLGFSGQDKIVMNSRGEVFIAFRKKVQGKYAVHVAAAKLNGGKVEISEVKSVSPQDAKIADGQRVPSLAIDQKDNLHIVWYSDVGKGGRQIKYSNSTDGGDSWSEPVVVAFVEGFGGEDLWQEHPSIFAGEQTLFIAWEGKDAEHKNQQIKFSKSVDGKEWTKWINVGPGIDSQSRPTILQDKNKTLFIFAYSRNGLTNQQIWYTKSEDQGSTWSPWVRVSEGDTDARHQDSILDNRNIIHIAWRQYKDNKTRIFYRQLKDGILGPIEEVPAENNYQFFPQLGFSGNKIFLVWFESQKSGFPQEDPKNGEVVIALKESNGFEKRFLTGGIYPNVLSGLSVNNGTVILYAEVLKSGAQIKMVQPQF